ncbi:DegT/DnrJ/EryC1/StrS family aminotransferase [Clostridium neuense]|uniref:DegT/DnrJ/EryC1/StrS family aminotransferase n=1 Tax=Clostridium neuense TaxID=1728934 RepID=A0ABW8TGE3_9CLOT
MIRLSLPYITEDEIKEVTEVLNSRYLVQGEKVKQFEKVISSYLKVKYCIAVSSGTAALHLALLAIGIKKGDEIIVPDFTFPATANSVELTGANTKFVDINLDSFCIDEDKLEEKITEKTRAIIPVQEFGQSADMDKIMDIARRYKLRVIEDAACALGAEYKGKKVGTIGDIGCFSFHARKPITTGEGGILVTNDEEIAKKVEILRNHGEEIINGKVDFVEAGFNYRMTDIQAAIGIAQMKKIKEMMDYRRQIAYEYNKFLKDEALLTFPCEKNYGRHIYQTYHILLNKSINREFVKGKLKEKGIESNLGAYAVHCQSYYRNKYKFNDKDFQNSIYAYENGLALPMYQELDLKEIKFICDCIKKSILWSDKNKI